MVACATIIQVIAQLLIKAGTDIDYVGASAVELVGSGESAGNYREIDVTDGKIVTNPGWFGEKGTMRVLVQTHVKGHAELNAMGVPNAMSFAKTDEQRAMLELFFAQQVFGRPYVVAPQVPKDRVEALRKAFWATLKDPELLADAKRANLEVDPVSAEDVQALIAKIYASPREITEKIKKAIQLN